MQVGFKYDYSLENKVVKPYNLFAKVYKLIPAGINVLEAGCHTGQFGALLRRKGCRVTGVEIDPDAVQRAKLALDRVRLTNLEEEEVFQEFKEQFDVILFMDVLEHCRNPEEILRRARKALAPNGFVITSIPNIANWSIRWNLLRGRFEYERVGIMDQTHIKFYTIKTVTRLFENAGYKIELMDYTYSFPVFRVRKLIGGILAKTVGRLLPGLFSYQMVIKARPKGSD